MSVESQLDAASERRQVSPKRLFAANFLLNSIEYLQVHWPLLALTGTLLFSRRIFRRYNKIRWSVTNSQKVMTSNEIAELLRTQKEIWLRVQVTGLQTFHYHDSQAGSNDGDVIPTNQKPSVRHHALHFVHSPLFALPQRSSPANSYQVIQSSNEPQPVPHGVLEVKLAGLDYPLSNSAVKELQTPRLKLFPRQNRANFWYALISRRENSNTISSLAKRDNDQTEPFRVWLIEPSSWHGFRRRLLDGKDSLQAHLVYRGYSELTPMYRKVDFEEWAVGTEIGHSSSTLSQEDEQMISVELCNRLGSLQDDEKDARSNQRGPLWSKYRSEFQSYLLANQWRAKKEWLSNQISLLFRSG